jgi:hypothetical protein
MRRVKELLRLAHELGYSKRQIAQSIRMPKTTVGDYLTRAEAAGLRYADVAGMSEEAVEALLFRRAELPEQRPMPDWESAELGKRGVMLIWEEYRQQHRDGYSYSQFRRHFLDHTSASAEPRMRREHAPAAACEVDYAGMTLTISTAEGQASIFVGCLPFSGYLYAEATWTAEDWLASHCSATLTVSWRNWCPTISRSPMPASTTRWSTITSWRAITAPASFRPGSGGHGTRPVRKRASRWSRPGFWRLCATACSSRWTSGDPGVARRG